MDLCPSRVQSGVLILPARRDLELKARSSREHESCNHGTLVLVGIVWQLIPEKILSTVVIFFPTDSTRYSFQIPERARVSPSSPFLWPMPLASCYTAPFRSS